ncbi:AAA family ATPase [Paracraurococcus lichenis]|uniref:AAA family ATPase n=1 Tax=Paracraurococcus lichenis TaxID=3064888 RepID=A0ABT9E8J5_9PROT|nr:AAA family ATPase [Paracraurococcus sp. LOR1-02]MDO9712298.1 AAA family ATPase [Paracraurococcus sp. LOR1-02]
MTGPRLKELEVTNFRSIRGHVHAPLDASVVLIHGENGAGKTSLLSAIELALTGAVQSLQRADPSYTVQLLHRSSTQGAVILRTEISDDEAVFDAVLDSGSLRTGRTLDAKRASFFSERAYLPQSLLGQLLQIYQDSNSEVGSPLAKFVSKLLSLDRLDALEAGLRPLADLRNVRKLAPGWSGLETKRTSAERLVNDQRRIRKEIAERLGTDIQRLQGLCATLGLEHPVTEVTLEALPRALDPSDDVKLLDHLEDRSRELRALRREVEGARISTGTDVIQSENSAAAEDYVAWQREHGPAIAELRARVEALLPNVVLSSDLAGFVDDAPTRVLAAAMEAASRATSARADAARLIVVEGQREASVRQRDAIDKEIAAIPGDASGLATALAELSAFVRDETCPVCDRDYAENGRGRLAEHVHAKVRRLSGAAERLLALGGSRAEAQALVESLDRQLETLRATVIDSRALAELDRRSAALEAAAKALQSATATLREGARLLALDVEIRRAASAAQVRDATLLAARENLQAFVASVNAEPLAEAESLSDAFGRIQASLQVEIERLRARLSTRREATALLAIVRETIGRREVVDRSIEADSKMLREAATVLKQAQAVREQGLAIRNAVDGVRSTIIRREFNDRLNRVWRDLFVRLAPTEPFVPAFSIPEASTQRLQPKLVTQHRSGGDVGGTPGAMLSAGNLNTAALTLFIALHLSVPRELPWLILDDPVQSMDDVHIANLAALLRTLSKEHGRQVIVAVHDRQLFEYLRLELSPAFPDDSLLTLELSRGVRRGTLCEHRRYHFQDETTLLVA